MRKLENRTRRYGIGLCTLLAIGALTALSLVSPAESQDTPSTSSFAPSSGAVDAIDESDTLADEIIRLMRQIIVEASLGLIDTEIVTLPLDLEPGKPLAATISLDGQPYRLQLAPHSVRSPNYQLLVQGEDGEIRQADAGPVRTLRGSVAGVPNSSVTASMLEDGLHAMIQLDADTRYWLEPIVRFVPDAFDDYVVYSDDDVLPHGGTCGLPDAAAAEKKLPPGIIIDRPQTQTQTRGSFCIAELACDADTEYFNDYGTVPATEARINSVINTVNSQYETQVAITHLITTIIVRTASDPYTSTDPEGRLCQFITEWTNNQGAIQRDVAHLFTGVDINGGVIGIAADIGATGICQNNGACTGGQFGTQGSYCMSQSDFNGSFACATDLTAHELGHLWGAFHCNCPSNTMNPGITCTNVFSGGSINSISAYRDTRTCLDGSCAGGPTPPPNDSCSTPTLIACTTQEIFNTATATPVSGSTDPELPAGSPSCQWQGTPSNTHNTVWFEFIAADTSVEIETCATTAIQDTIVALYDGSCGALTELSCSEDVCGSTTYMSSICFNGLVPGNSYLIMVGNPGGWGGSTPGQIIMDVACPCPAIGPVAGACCLPGGGCAEPETPNSCASLGGTFQGAGSNCAGANCGPATTGACCLAGGSCSVETPNDCAQLFGTYLGDGTDCSLDSDFDGTPDCADGCPNDPTKTAPGVCGCGNPETDSDNDGTPDCVDGCPNDPNKIAPGICGCGISDVDSDNDGTPDCNDQCPNDPNKIAPGDCGCGTPDIDSDNDGVADCIDGCPNDPNKIDPGICGCGISDIDSDNDGTPDCNDQCPNDPNKIAPGDCGCGISDVDSDNDGVADCNDGCPNDPNKIAPGVCGCGISDIDSDNDGTPDCNDQCPNDPNKIAPGDCGCGIPDIDSDNDGVADCNDGCPNDPNKIAPGDCGCGTPDNDSDNDGVADCIDGCPNDPNKIAPGVCGCGISDVDSDNDGTPDCNDQCPNDPNKIAPGICGCGISDVDSDNDGTPDCNDPCPTDPNDTCLLEACCMPDGTCTDVLPADCTNTGGVPQGPATTCAGVNCPVSCTGDITDANGVGPDGAVDVFDLLELLANWGTNGPGADIAPPNNVVDVFDLLDLLAAWGDC